MKTAAFIKVSAGVRHWEDTIINGTEDVNGDMIPFRIGETWCPLIDLRTGHIVDWPQGMEADIHYKVCDAGEYWLLDEEKRTIAKWKGSYVPNDFLCHGDDGFGDYIVFEVSGDGKIKDWHRPEIDPERWKIIE